MRILKTFPKRKAALTHTQRRALQLLVGCPGGITQGIILSFGVEHSEIQKLVDAGFARIRGETVPGGSKVNRVFVTDAGRRAI